MKKTLTPIFISIGAVLLFLVSCGITMMEEGETVNEYIFPYIEFTPSEDGSGYTATVVEGAKLDSIYIPSSIEIDGKSISVTSFGGFSNSDDALALKELRLESTSTQIAPEALETAHNLMDIAVDRNDTNERWGSLPVVEKEGMEFLGWFYEGTDEEVKEGDLIDPSRTKVGPRWRNHTLVHHEGKDPTCTSVGWNEYDTCETCDYTTYIEIAKTDHTLIHFDEKSSTCTEEGNREYWSCFLCGRFFSDSGGEYEITQVTIPAKGHSLYRVPGKEAECGKSGEKEHWECSSCRALFSDEDGTVSVTINDITVPALLHDWRRTEYSSSSSCVWYECAICHETKDAAGHTWDDGTEVRKATESESGRIRYTCTLCGNSKYEDTEPLSSSHVHSWSDIERIAATCTARGYTVRECSGCGVTYRYCYVDPEGHSMKTVEAADATCTAWGNTKYYECTVCHTLYRDANGINATTIDEVRKNREPLGHQWKTEYSTDGTYHWHECIRGGCTATDGKTVHSYTEENTDERYLKSDATCTSPALYFTSCVCGLRGEETFTSGEALGHDLVHHDGRNATCTEEGWNEYWVCQRENCGRSFLDEACQEEITGTDSNVIPKTPHTPSAKYESEGSSGHREICSVCGHPFGDAIPHTVDDYEWTGSDSTGHWHRCRYCDYRADYERHTFHSYGSDEVCSECLYVRDTEHKSDGSFDITAETAEPEGTLSIDSRTGFSHKAVFTLSEGSVKTGVEWYLDNALIAEGKDSIAFETSAYRTYTLMCVVYNNNLANSYSQTVYGGSSDDI